MTIRRTGLTDDQLRDTPLPVSGPLTDTELRAAPVPVSGAVTTGGLTDPELRATAVPVSGPLTDAQLRATDVGVSESDLRLMIRLLLSILESPVWLNKTSNALQTLLLTGSTTAVTGTLTAVTTVTGLTNIGGISADMVVANQLNELWAVAVRANLS
jgi:hypothetical protein